MTPDLQTLCEVTLRSHFFEEEFTGLRNDGLVSGEMHRDMGNEAVVRASPRISVMATRSWHGLRRASP